MEIRFIYLEDVLVTHALIFTNLKSMKIYGSLYKVSCNNQIKLQALVSVMQGKFLKTIFIFLVAMTESSD